MNSPYFASRNQARRCSFCGSGGRGGACASMIRVCANSSAPASIPRVERILRIMTLACTILYRLSKGRRAMRHGMMTLAALLLSVSVLGTIPVTARHAGATGRWVWRVDNNDGTSRDTVFALAQQGATLTGSVITVNSETPIIDGVVDGEAVRFATVTGPAANPRRTAYRGTLASDELRLTIVRPGRADEQITATRGA